MREGKRLGEGIEMKDEVIGREGTIGKGGRKGRRGKWVIRGQRNERKTGMGK